MNRFGLVLLTCILASGCVSTQERVLYAAYRIDKVFHPGNPIVMSFGSPGSIRAEWGRLSDDPYCHECSQPEAGAGLIDSFIAEARSRCAENGWSDCAAFWKEADAKITARKKLVQ